MKSDDVSATSGTFPVSGIQCHCDPKIVLFVLLAALSGLVAYWLGLFETAYVHDQHDGEE